MRRALKILGWSLLGLVALVVVVVGGALLALQTAPVQARLAALIEGAASQEGGLGVQIGSLDGTLPVDVVVRDLVLSDPDGAWLTVDRARVAWRPLDLLRGRLTVGAVEAGTIAVARAPVLPPAPESEEPAGGGLPQLPVGIVVERLAIDAVALGEPLLGEAARLSVDGSARLTSLADGLQAQLSVTRLDGVTGTLSAQLGYQPVDETLSVTVALEEPAGGVVARAAQLPGLPPVTLSIVGSGPLDGWDATVVARAGDLGVVEADLGIGAVEGGRRLTLDAFGLPGPAVGAKLAPLLGDRPTIAGAAVLGDDGAIALDRLAVETAAATLSAAGTVDPGAGTLAVEAEVVAADPAALAPILPGATWQDLTLIATAEGPFTAPDLTATVEATGAGYAAGGLDAGAGRLTLDLTATPDGPLGAPGSTIAVDLAARAEGARSGIGAIDPLLDGPVSLDVVGTTSLAGSVAVDDLVLALPPGRLTAAGALDGWGLTGADLEATLAVPELAALGGLAGPLTGSLDLQAAVARDAAGETTVALTGGLGDPALGIPAVEALLGDAVAIEAQAGLAADGSVALDRLAVDAAAARLTADGVLAGGAVALGWTLDLPRLDAVDAGVTGAATLAGDVTGPLDDLTAGLSVEAAEIAAGGETVTGLAAEAVVGGLTTGRPSGRVRLDATWRDEPVRLATRFAVTEDRALRLDDVALSAAGLDGGGAATLAADGAVDGGLEITAADLSLLSALAGIDIDGAATLRLDGAIDADGAAAAGVSVTVENLRVAGAAVRSGQLDATIADPLGRRAIEATLEATGVAAGGESINRLAVTAEGSINEGFAVTVDAEGAPAAVSTAGTVTVGAPAEGTPAGADADAPPAAVTVALDRLDGRFLGNPFRITQPATIAVGGGALAVDGLRLAGRQGRIAADGRLGEAFDLTVRLEEAPLELLRLVSPDLAMTGRLDGRLTLAGTRAAPEADLTLSADGVESDVAARAGLPGFDLAAEARWAGGRLDAEASVVGAAGGRIDVRAGFPLAANAGGFPAVALDVPLEAAVEGRVDLALFNDLLAAGADRVTGILTVDVDLGGTLAAPSAGGRIAIADASWQNALYGIELTDIQAEAVGDAQAFRLVELTAATPGEGTIRAEGRLDLDPAAGFPGRFEVVANDARVIDSDLVDATIDADLALSGALGRAPELAGTVEIARMTVRIAESLPGGVTTIEAVEVNPTPELAERVAADRAARDGESAGGATVPLALDLTLSAPGTVFVTGRGLDARMSGTLAIGGTANAPRIDGALGLDRGTLDVLTKRFDFTRGEITFLGSALDPALDFRAETPAGDVTGIVTVGGFASDPTLALSSEPELPEDEVLSQILFGKGTGQLSTFEAVQLGQQAAELAGVLPAGSGLVENVRRSTGLDVLNVETGDDGEAALTAGQFVGEGVFVGVEQSLGSNESNVTVEVDITDTIKLETDLGSTGSTRIGVGVEFDY